MTIETILMKGMEREFLKFCILVILKSRVLKLLELELSWKSEVFLYLVVLRHVENKLLSLNDMKLII